MSKALLALLVLSASPMDELRYTPQEMSRYQTLRDELVADFACVFELADWNGRQQLRYVAFATAKKAPSRPAQLQVSLTVDGKHEMPSPGPDAADLAKRCGFATNAKRADWPLNLFGGATPDQSVEQFVVCQDGAPVALKVSHKASGKEVVCRLPDAFR